MSGIVKNDQYDIAIVGGGLVGAAAAVAFAGHHFRVALIAEKCPDFHPDSIVQDGLWDSRIYAISPGNVDWFKKMGVWEKLNVNRLSNIERMQIWGDEIATSLDFNAYDANVVSLGVILESRQLLQALWTQMQELGVHIETGSLCEELIRAEENVTTSIIVLSSGKKISASLVVGADGGNSWVRRNAGIAVNEHAYNQMGVVANFEPEKPHNNIARQWFLENGVMAWLPLPGNRISMVWSIKNPDTLLKASPTELSKRVAEAGQHVLGNLRALTSPHAFKLLKQTAEKIVQPGIVLVGDAAHQIHPLAGQGVNLGFRDVIALERVLGKRSKLQDIGDFFLLRQYARERKMDVFTLGAVTHGLQWLFDNEEPLLKKIRNVGLALTNQQAYIKTRLIQRALN